MVTRTTNLAEATAHRDHAQMTVRLKYTDPREMLAEYLASNAKIGRTQCPVCDYLTAHLDDDVVDLERHIYSHPVWGPNVICETMYGTLAFNNAATHPHGEEIAAAIQLSMAHELTKHPWGKIRYHVELMLAHPDMRFASQEALEIVLALVRDNHPNPKRILTHPRVRPHIPAHVDLTHYAAPDFPEMHGVPAFGGHHHPTTETTTTHAG